MLGNSGESGQTLVAFEGKPAPGMGPVLDARATLWERGGSRRLCRYSLDGRLLASFEIPESERPNDQLTLVGDTLVLKIGSRLFTLATEAAPGAVPAPLEGEAETLSADTFDGRVVLFDRGPAELCWLDPTTGTREPIVKPGFNVQALGTGDDGTVYAFGGGQVHAWKDSLAVVGFPKPFDGERPQRIGRHWYSHAWHGTIKRANERFEPSPGVVLGGASGSFIGYLPQSGDLTNGRGIVHVRDDVYAVSGMSGIVQLLRWNDEELRFELARRLGALPELTGLAIDASGNVWTPNGSWRWTAGPEAALTIGDKKPDLHVQPVILGGRTLCLLKKHYSYVQLARGPCIDSDGWSRFEISGLDDLMLFDQATGAAAVPTKDGLSLIVVERGGTAFEIGIDEKGRPVSPPSPINVTGLSDCTSLAWYDDRLVAADSGSVIIFERDGERNWKESARIAKFDGPAYVHGDGERLVVTDTAGGVARVYDSLDSSPAIIEGLASPTHSAISGDRIVVYESGRQRLVKLELVGERAAAPAVGNWSVVTIAAPTTDVAQFVDADYQNLSRPGGLPLAVAIEANGQGLAVSLRTKTKTPPAIELGVANAADAFLLSEKQAVSPAAGRYDYRLPPGDWSTIRLAVALSLPAECERFGLIDGRAIHAPFSDDPADWAPFDLAEYRERAESRRQEIRVGFTQPWDGKATAVIETESGKRVRNLVAGRSFTAGERTLVWDGFDDEGRLVSPGTYRVRGIMHRGVEPAYRMNFGNGGELTVEPWGPNHSTFRSAASNGKHVFFAAPVTEGGWALVALDQDGKFVQGYEHLHGYGIQHDAVAADERYLYCAQDGFAWGRHVDPSDTTWTDEWKVTIVRYDVATGKLVEFPVGRRAVEVDAMTVGPGSDHPDLSQFNLAGLAAKDGKLYVGSRDEKAVLILDAETGRRLDSIPLNGVRHVAAGDELYAACDQGVVRLRDGKLLIEAGEMELTGITVAPNGDLLVSDAASHQIRRYDAEGRFLVAIGTPGGPYRGAYDPARMVRPVGLAFGPDGKLWVTEERWNPKRVLAWDLKRGAVVYEKFGMPHYGGDGSGFDPEDPRRWIGLGCFWDVDVERGTARPTHILSIDEGHFGNYHPQGYLFFREAGRTFVSTRGKIAVVSEVLPDGTLHDLAAVAGTHEFAYGCDWNPPQAYIDAFFKKWPEKRPDEPKRNLPGERQPWSQRGMGVLWVDRNGDGRTQAEEFDFCGDRLDLGGGAWGHLQNSLTLYVPASDGKQVRIVALEPRGVLAGGAPDYPSLEEALAKSVPVDLSPGYKRSGVSTVRDRFGRFLFNSDPEMNAYATAPAETPGAHAWSFPNRWSDVHGSHDAPLPEPGVMQGTMAFLGIAPFDAEADVVFLNGNHGRCFLMTTDGLYLDEAFVDVRVSYLKNEYRLGGEIFGGTFGKSIPDDKYYVQIGHGPYRIYELTGLQGAERFSSRFEVTGEHIAAAERTSLRRVAERHAPRVADVPGTIKWNRDGRFPVEIDVRADKNHLHLVYRVRDASPWKNAGRDWTKLFATGDSVDLQIASDPTADARRTSPVPGDRRLVIAPCEGEAVAVLYEHRRPGGPNPIAFASPWRGEKVDNVERLEDVSIDVRVEGEGYQVTASIPLERLGLTPREAGAYRGDFGVTYGDAEGTDVNLRSYWSNENVGLVDDIPGEIMLFPNLWGEIRFVTPDDRPRTNAESRP